MSITSWFRARPMATDSVLAGALLLLGIFGALAAPTPYQPKLTSGPVFIVIQLVLGVAPVVIRRRWPTVALAATGVLGMAAVVSLVNGTESYAMIIVTYTVAARWQLRRALVGSLLVWVPIVGASLFALGHWPHGKTPEWALSPSFILITNLLIFGGTFLLGRYMFGRRAAEAALRERTRVAERNQQALAEQAVADERRRIARELHDVVAHHVSVMGILATGARRSMTSNPAAASAALETIEETGRATLRELRRLLDIMRTDDEQVDLTPQPGLAGVPALVEQLREAGLVVELTVDGEPYDLDPGIALTVFRIVQEALTNTLKHAGNATAQVTLTFAEDRVEVTAADNGRGPALAPNRAGHGLVGIRERVALYGGQLRLGARPGGGFRIAASIPVERPGSVHP